MCEQCPSDQECKNIQGAGYALSLGISESQASRKPVLRSRLINGWHPVFLGLKKPSASVQAQLDMEAVVLFHCAAMGMSCPSCPWYSVGAGSLSKKSETKSTLRRKDQSLTTRNQEVVPSW